MMHTKAWEDKVCELKWVSIKILSHEMHKKRDLGGYKKQYRLLEKGKKWRGMVTLSYLVKVYLILFFWNDENWEFPRMSSKQTLYVPKEKEQLTCDWMDTYDLRRINI